MIRRVLAIALLAATATASSPVRAAAPGSCPNDSKLLNEGPTRVFGEGPGTWWDLILTGMIEAGFVTDAEQIAYLNQVFGTDFTTLAELEAFNVQLVSDTWDVNQNGYVCAFELRGTRKHFGDPFLNDTFFGVSDDRIR